MSYYTKFDFRRAYGPKGEYTEALKEIDGCLGGDDISSVEAVYAKWPDYESDMEHVSKNYPGVVIQIDGTGEDSGDVWRDFWRNGERHHEAMRLK